MFDCDHGSDAPIETKSADTPIGARTDAPEKPRPLRYRPRRNTSDRLRDALLTLANNQGAITNHEEAPWSSITFTGSRHEIALEFEGHDAVEAGETLIAELPEHEFSIPGQLVADASVREVDHRFGADEQLNVTCVLLLLEDV
ncbi:MAG: hypothetical protein AAF251_16690 [Pseudomonadota bacterium]